MRAGIEATLSQNIRNCGLRPSRYRGLARTHVQHVLTALACNSPASPTGSPIRHPPAADQHTSTPCAPPPTSPTESWHCA
ncbi:transposase [Streptomyces sp. NPDC050485]|uniref:transposase n=1 Tax=Streptomyces sp. NPDC050485 TaxID=3365617 RepID=UPI00378A4FEC